MVQRINSLLSILIIRINLYTYISKVLVIYGTLTSYRYNLGITIYSLLVFLSLFNIILTDFQIPSLASSKALL